MLHGWPSSGNLGAWCAKAGGAHSSKEGNDTCRGWKLYRCMVEELSNTSDMDDST